MQDQEISSVAELEITRTREEKRKYKKPSFLKYMAKLNKRVTHIFSLIRQHNVKTNYKNTIISLAWFKNVKNKRKNKISLAVTTMLKLTTRTQLYIKNDLTMLRIK